MLLPSSERYPALGNFYGTTQQAVENVLSKGPCSLLIYVSELDLVGGTGLIWLKDIDMCGCTQLREHPTFRPLFIMVVAPSEAELERRLRSRGTDPEEVCES